MIPKIDENVGVSGTSTLLPLFHTDTSAPPEFGENGFFAYYARKSFNKTFIGDEHHLPLFDVFNNSNINNIYQQLLLFEFNTLAVPAQSVLVTLLAYILRMYAKCRDINMLSYEFSLAALSALWITSFAGSFMLFSSGGTSYREQLAKSAPFDLLITYLRIIVNIIVLVQVLLDLTYARAGSSLAGVNLSLLLAFISLDLVTGVQKCMIEESSIGLYLCSMLDAIKIIILFLVVLNLHHFEPLNEHNNNVYLLCGLLVVLQACRFNVSRALNYCTYVLFFATFVCFVVFATMCLPSCEKLC